MIDIEMLENQIDCEPQRVGMLQVQTANDTMMAAATMPARKPLYKRLWHEGEMACLFGDTNCGKSILAVQIAEEIAQAGKGVLYVDLELSPKQFQGRYSDPLTGDSHNFSPNLHRAEICPESFKYDGKFEDALLSDIEKTALTAKCTVLIVDNLTYLCSNMETGRDASVFMFKLREVKLKWGWSTLIIAHTPKRQANTPITINDLAGSRKLAVFFDAIFALAVAGNNAGGVRYIIQLKCREGEFTNGDNNVIVGHLVKDGTWLHLSEDGTATESRMLQKNGAIAFRANNLYGQGMTQKQIAAMLTAEGTPVQQYTISRLLKK